MYDIHRRRIRSDFPRRVSFACLVFLGFLVWYPLAAWSGFRCCFLCLSLFLGGEGGIFFIFFIIFFFLPPQEFERTATVVALIRAVNPSLLE